MCVKRPNAFEPRTCECAPFSCNLRSGSSSESGRCKSCAGKYRADLARSTWRGPVHRVRSLRPIARRRRVFCLKRAFRLCPTGCNLSQRCNLGIRRFPPALWTLPAALKEASKFPRQSPKARVRAARSASAWKTGNGQIRRPLCCWCLALRAARAAAGSLSPPAPQYVPSQPLSLKSLKSLRSRRRRPPALSSRDLPWTCRRWRPTQMRRQRRKRMLRQGPYPRRLGRCPP
mmetsp:Transcript_117912/g.279842  ORF Transcript_117912/g.279842 Transcript_117912/m.279842 type:complete len:231 (+) Transcript_117912:1244-1936(+)